ncbi:hypothetical protein YQE_00996, partial [Dendroctonus ponderosae]
ANHGISSQVTQSHKSIELEFHSALNTDVKFATSCVILNRLTCNLPRVTLNVNKLQIPKCIRAELADPTFFESQPVDLLLGMDIYGELLNGGFKQLGKNQPVLINTYLGWTLSGGIHERFGFNNDQKADDLLQKFWTLEELPGSASFSVDDELAEQLFKDNTCRLNDGRFQVKLPLKSPLESEKLGDSYQQAKRRFFSLGNKFNKNPKIFEQYKQFIHEYISLGHAKETVTYGTSSAPFLATRCLLELAKTNQQSHPLAAEAILHQCYVDDIISGCNTLNELTNLHYEQTSLVGSAGMSLHKWSSNSPQFLNAISAQTNQPNYIIPSLSEGSKVLGMSWNPNEDIFQISVPKIDLVKIETKRQVLASIAQIFDPMGLINPYIVLAKLIMQEIWLNKISWDEKLNTELLKKWTKFTTGISTWLNSHPNRWSVFVGNRVSQVQSLTQDCKWYNVKSKDNPADLLSRGCMPYDLPTLWWHEPAFLQERHSNFPHKSHFKISNPPEERKSALLSQVINDNEEFLTSLNRFSKLSKTSRCNRSLLSLRV